MLKNCQLKLISTEKEKPRCQCLYVGSIIKDCWRYKQWQRWCVYRDAIQIRSIYPYYCQKEVVEKIKTEWRAVRELGEINVNGSSGIQLQCYFGSSTYDSKEMATLIDGVVREAKELGIETLPPDELLRMKQEWDIGNSNSK